MCTPSATICQSTTEVSFTVLRENPSAFNFTRLLVLGVSFYEVSLPRNVVFYSEGSPLTLFGTYMIKHWPLEQLARAYRKR